MQHHDANKAAAEAGKVLDALSALSMELSCHCDVPPDRLVLQAGQLRDTCEAIDEAVESLKRILAIADANGASVHGKGTPRDT